MQDKPQPAPPAIHRRLPPEEHATRIKQASAELNKAIAAAAVDGVCVTMEARSDAMGDMLGQRLDIRVWRQL